MEWLTVTIQFTWEDPAVDMQHLGLTSEDSLLCITSAGDNALHCEYFLSSTQIRCDQADIFNQTLSTALLVNSQG